MGAGASEATSPAGLRAAHRRAALGPEGADLQARRRAEEVDGRAVFALRLSQLPKNALIVVQNAGEKLVALPRTERSFQMFDLPLDDPGVALQLLDSRGLVDVLGPPRVVVLLARRARRGRRPIRRRRQRGPVGRGNRGKPPLAIARWAAAAATPLRGFAGLQ